MAVFPFYTEIKSSTRENKVGVGCRAKNGDMTTYVKQRDEGGITTPYKIYQSSFHENGVLYLSTQVMYKNPDTDVFEVIHEHITKY